MGGQASADPQFVAQRSISVYPNPEAQWRVQVERGRWHQSLSSEVVVFDAVGRQVFSQTLNATAINTTSVNIDLIKEKAGLYTLEVRSDAGVAQQKLVIE
ncbi:MAG: T9SS type A sorting domain-containing protein [Hymenobacter sp.]